MAEKKTHKQFMQEFKEKNTKNITVLGTYTSGHNKILCRCNKCNHEWEAPPDSLKSGCGCPECGKEKNINSRRLSQEEFDRRLHEANPNIIAITLYVNLRTKLKAQCKICQRRS